VERANSWAQLLGVSGSARYLFGNATVSLGPLLRSYPGAVRCIALQFPDPQVPRRAAHPRVPSPLPRPARRAVATLRPVASGGLCAPLFRAPRMPPARSRPSPPPATPARPAPQVRRHLIMQPQLALDVAAALQPGGRLVVQSDVREVAAGVNSVLLEAAGRSFRLAPEHLREQQLGGSGGCTDSSGGAGAGGRQQGQQQEAWQQEAGAGVSWSLPGGAADVPGPAVSYPRDDASCLLPWLQRGGAAGAAGACEAGAGGQAVPQWLGTTPLGVPTERELYVRRGRRPIWRFALVRR
jgi:hypothetical protein